VLSLIHASSGAASTASRGKRGAVLVLDLVMAKMVVSDKKSVLASGLLSFFLGPLGWFYAAPLKNAAIGGGAYLLCGAILPSFILFYVVGIVAPISAISGIIYALGYNATGERLPIFGKSKDEPKRLSS